MIDFGSKLKCLRGGRHLSQTQVAQQLGCIPSMVSAYEASIPPPLSYSTVRRRAGFKISVDSPYFCAKRADA